MTFAASYLAYWGKTGSSAQDQPAFHRLVFHSLDVAAVGSVLLRRHSALRRFLARSLGLPEAIATPWIVYLLAVHDLGKFAMAFQMQNETVVRALGRKPVQKTYPPYHDSLGFAVWLNEIATPILDDRVPNDRQDDWADFLEPIAQAITCHHGQPADTNALNIWKRSFLADDLTAAHEYANDAATLLLGDCVFPTDLDPEPLLNNRVSEHASWWLAGFAVLCDWLGSNRELFPFKQDPLDLETYWQDHALPQAESAVKATQLLPAKSAKAKELTQLFEHLSRPTPLQALAQELALPDSPQLFLLEDITGAGKTEAAFVLLHRLLAAGLSEGFFVGLPTMATANAMFRRSELVYARLFDDKSTVSHVLAHG
ncbi:MAG: CRISPR-associated endonuclease Cas3'', partial [Gammaproteobacteria bacterium]